MITLPSRDTPIRELPWAILDVETTGLRATLGHRVCEIAVHRYEPHQPPKQLSTLINPGRTIEAEASAIHGLTHTDVAASPSFAEILEPLHTLLDGAVVIAHNARFDVGFLVIEHHIAKAPLPQNPVIDTLAIAPELLQVESGSLQALAHHLNLSHGRLHRADSDVDVTFHIFEQILQALEATGTIVTLDDLLKQQQLHIKWAFPEPEALPEVLSVALEKGLSVQIRYRKAVGEITERLVKPMLASDRHLVAYCHLRNDQRTFRLDRILDAQWPAKAS